MKTKDEIIEVEVTCHRCEYHWTFRGLKLLNLGKYPVYAQCPNCRTSVTIKIPKEEDKK